MVRKKNIFSLKQIFSVYFTVAIPLLYLYNIQIAFQYSHTFISSLSVVFLGIILSLLGALLWIISYINLGSSFGVLPQKHTVVKRGLYRYTNHPMYISIWLTFLGISLANQSWQSLAFLNVILLPVLFIRATMEERLLVNNQ